MDKTDEIQKEIQKQTELVSQMLAFESGKMNAEQLATFFQELIDTGMAWKLQGIYGRMASHLLELGYVKQRSPPKTEQAKAPTSAKTVYAPVLVYGAIVNDIEVFEDETEAIDYFCEAMHEEFGQYMIKLANGHWEVPDWIKLDEAIGNDEMSSGSTIYHLTLHPKTRSPDEQARIVAEKIAKKYNLG